MGNRKFILIFLISVVLTSGCVMNEKIAKYTSGKIKEPVLTYSPPEYSFTAKKYNNPEYELPLRELPENYQRDIVEKFGKNLTEKQ
ncbi:MAG: hypothetical protein DRP18_02060, partial [Candidatus Aenigmatarchaeota archaeon]